MTPSGRSCPSVFAVPVLRLFLFQGCEDSMPLTSNFGLGRMGFQISFHIGFCDLSLSHGSPVLNWGVGCTYNLGQFSSVSFWPRRKEPGDPIIQAIDAGASRGEGAGGTAGSPLSPRKRRAQSRSAVQFSRLPLPSPSSLLPSVPTPTRPSPPLQVRAPGS